MINIENAKKEFLKYVDNYDKSNVNISRKKRHSLSVMELSKEIAENLNLSKEEIDLAMLIGLLHDIGRFEQWKKYETFVDLKSVDHGELGIEILQKDNFLRKFIAESKDDEIIYTAIKNHNKYAIEEGLNGRKLLHSQIIRDADKLDIFCESVYMFWETEEEKNNIENSGPISDEYFSQLKDHKPILLKPGNPSKLNSIFLKIAMVFDLNFKFSIEYLKEKNYINLIIDRFNLKNEKAKMQIEVARNVVNGYINKKC